MSQDIDKKDWEEYLSGNSQLSQEYHKHTHESAPSHLEQAILSAAHVKQKRKKKPMGPFGFNWMIPASLAAVLVISVSIVPLMQEQIRTHETAMEPVKDFPQEKQKQPAATVADKAVKYKSSKQAAKPAARPAPRKYSPEQARLQELKRKRAMETARIRREARLKMAQKKERIEDRAMAKSQDVMKAAPARAYPPVAVNGYSTEKEESVDSLITKIRELIKEGKMSEARKQLEAVKKLYPNHPSLQALKKDHPSLFSLQ